MRQPSTITRWRQILPFFVGPAILPNSSVAVGTTITRRPYRDPFSGIPPANDLQ
jgi:hypothetical protein